MKKLLTALLLLPLLALASPLDLKVDSKTYQLVDPTHLNFTGATITNFPESNVVSLVSDLALKAPLASPTFTGTPLAPTATGGTNTTQIATTAFVQTAVAGVTFSGAANLVLGTPDGTSGTASLRSLVLTDLPAIPESKLSISDNTTANVSTSSHGFVLKLPGDPTLFYNGDGAYVAIPATGGTAGSQIISGGGVACETTDCSTLGFVVSAATYTINGTQYSSPQTTVTLTTADPSFDRIDVIALDDSGAVVVIDGNASVSPQQPTVDPTSQVFDTFIYVPAGSSAPSFTTENIYLEDTEYTMSASAGTINVASTNNPFAGSKDIEGTAVTNGQSFTAVRGGGGLNLSNYTSVVFQLRSKATWPNQKAISIFWANGTTTTGTNVAVKNGVLGFSSSTTGSYQQIVIPVANFGTGNNTVDRIKFAVSGGGAAIGWYIDNIVLMGNTGGGGSGGGASSGSGGSSGGASSGGAGGAGGAGSGGGGAASSGSASGAAGSGTSGGTGSGGNGGPGASGGGGNSGGGTGSGDFSTNTSTSIVNELMQFADTTGKLGKRSTGTGVAQLTSGVLSTGNVNLASQVTGNLPVTNLNSGTSANSSTFWRGDGTWSGVAGATGGTVTSVQQTTANGILVNGTTSATITGSGTFALTLGAITPTSVNGDTITTGTGTLTLGANTLTASHNITLDTDGTGTRTLNIGAGGTLGSNAFTSTAYTPTSRTLTIAGTALDLSADRAWTLDTITGVASNGYLKRTGTNTLTNVASISNGDLANSAITIAGTSTSLGGSISLDTISGVSSNGFLKRTGTNTWTNDASTYLTSSSIDDTAYDATTWNGATTVAPSKNAVRDKFESLTTTHTVTFVMDGSGATLVAATGSWVKIPYGGTLQGWTIIASPASSSITCDILRAADGAGLPASSIVGGSGTKPAISSGVENSSTSFTSWTSTTLTAKDNLAITTSGITTATYVCLTLYYQ